MKIGIDVDDVVLNLTEVWLERHNRLTGDHMTEKNITDWDMGKFAINGDGIYEILKHEDLYDQVPMVSGAADGIRELEEAGHEVVFITISHHPGKEKRLRDFGFHQPVIVAKNKAAENIDMMIDDNLETIQRVVEAGKKGVLFDRPWNRGVIIDGATRVYYWNEIVVRYGPGPDYFKAADYKSGLNPDAAVIVNTNGGKQSKVGYRFDLIDPTTLFHLANIAQYGAEKYGAWNWRRISVNDHLNHALGHLFAYLEGDQQDDHLGHAFCRMMFALSLVDNPGEVERMEPQQ